MFALRPYQQEAVDAVYRYLREKEGNPCVVIPTAGGKSLCLAQVARDAVERWGGRVCILAHVKELVEQNAGKLRAICPGLDVGVYSAGLGRRDTEQPVVVAGIQSVYNKAEHFRPFDLVVVDEVHMVPPEGEGRYRTFIDAIRIRNPRVRMVGFTATPFRDTGLPICGPGNVFTEICYEIGVKELIAQGFLSRITARAGQARADLSHLHVRAGEFVQEDVERVMGTDSVVETACREIVRLTKDRKTCLVFCTSVAHCRRVAKLITAFSGEECAVVTGETPDEVRARTIARLRGERVDVDLFGDAAPPLRYCCNVGVLTTGTDIPGIDTVVLLRPICSPGLYIQCVGRGFRLSPSTGKAECLVLDYGRNVERLGPVDAVNMRTAGRAGGEPLAKECPACHALIPLAAMLCPECGHAFPAPERERREHEQAAARAAILSGEETRETYDVVRTEFRVWEKRGAPPGSPRTVRVSYYIDMCTSFSEWLCPEHRGFARAKFEKWWRAHTDGRHPVPETAEDVCEADFMAQVKPTRRITVKTVSGVRYPEIVGWELGEVDERPDAPCANLTQEELDEDLPF